MSDGFKYTGLVYFSKGSKVSDAIIKYESNLKSTYVANYPIYTELSPNMTLKLIEKPLTAKPTSNLKNLKDCSIEDLEKAKGVGEKTAKLIYDYVKSGSDVSISDLETIKGVGPKTIDEIKKYCH